jgi:hypothetical protein
VFGGLWLKIKCELSTAEPEEKRLMGSLFVKQQPAFHLKRPSSIKALPTLTLGKDPFFISRFCLRKNLFWTTWQQCKGEI